MMNLWKSLVATALLLLPQAVVDAYPSAAGACPSGQAAVQSPHVGAGRTETTGTLADGGFVVWLNGYPVGADTTLSVGTEERIEVTGTTPFKGFLVRVGPPVGTNADLTAAIQGVGSETQVATSTCVDVESVGGLTHTGNSDKTNVTGTLLVEQAISGVVLDVTIVGVNSGSESSWWYSSFEIAVEGEDATTPVPVVSDATTPATAPGDAADAPAPSPTNETTTGEGMPTEEPPADGQAPAETTLPQETEAPSAAAVLSKGMASVWIAAVAASLGLWL